MIGLMQKQDTRFESRESQLDALVRGATLMVADGDHEMRKVICTALYMVGVSKIFEASDGHQVLGMLNNVTVDVVILDLLVGEMAGLDLIRIIRTSYSEHHRTMPIIVLSGLHDERRVMAARDAGATEFLIKPITPGLLLERVLDVIAHARPLTVSDGFIGPDRRRRLTVRYLGPERRPVTALTIEERLFLSARKRTGEPAAAPALRLRYSIERRVPGQGRRGDDQ